MAGVIDNDAPRVVIKKEIEDGLESPENAEVHDSPQNQPDANNSQKQTKDYVRTRRVSAQNNSLVREQSEKAGDAQMAYNYKVWSDDEIRSLIELQKGYVQKLKDGNYSKKQLMEDVAQELNLIGYETTPENVRYKMKYLRARYKGTAEYNSKHVEKKIMPFQQELSELFTMEGYEDPEPLLASTNCNGTIDISPKSIGSEKKRKRTKNIPAPHVDLKTVVTSRKKSSAVVKAKMLKKKAKRNQKASAHPLFQCGLCMNKFQTSCDMHDHICSKAAKANVSNGPKKKPVASANSIFHWNSLITMQYLDLLKEYQESHKNSNFRKGNIWDNMANLMKRLGYKIHPKILSKKWNLLSSSFEKTLAYNSTHKDKKKCAFFKRLMELYNHPSSFDCFKIKSVPAKRTVEVSPFSFSQQNHVLTNSPHLPNSSTPKFPKDDKTKPQPGSSDLLGWLNNTWLEYKAMERRRQELEHQRHNEIMEMLSYLIDSKH